MANKKSPDHDPLYSLPDIPHPELGVAKAATAAPPLPPVVVSEPDDNSTAVDLPDLITPSYQQVQESTNLEDKFTSAIRMAFIGAGQGGGRICQSFYDLGYRRVCSVNTTQQDLAALTMPGQLVIGNNRGGAGKDPEQGELAAKESFEEVMDLMMRSWGEGVEQIYVCVGGGGGSGTGSWPILIDAVREYCKSTNVERPIARSVGVIMSLPKRSEGARVQRNALAAVRQAIDMVGSKRISSLVIIDNAKIHDLYPGLPVKKFWGVANQSFAATLHTFNLLGAQNSAFNTFDRADFRSIVRNGLMIFGMTQVQKWTGKEDIAQAVRQNLKGSLLGDGFDLSKATMAGAIVVAHDDVLGNIPMENVDYALYSLGRALGNEGITIHNGIYEGKQPGMRVFTIVSGLQPPAERLAELARLAT